MRKTRRGKLKNQKKILIISMVAVLFTLSVGYATFSTNISLNAKGNIHETLHKANDFIEDLASKDTVTLINDGNGNIRYTGSSDSVHNYVCLSETDGNNCQDKHLYRIIGLFDNIKKTEEDTTGEKRIKVIKATEYGEEIWDLQDDGSTSNNWARPSTLNTKLNTVYYSDLDDKAKGVIESSVWYLGGNTSLKITSAQSYYNERNNPAYESNPTKTSGIFALMYPSDYGYASSACYSSVKLVKENSDEIDYKDSSCTSTNWLFPLKSDGTRSSEWVITPYSNSAVIVENITSFGGLLGIKNVKTSGTVRPTAYLKSNVKIDIKGRDGTQSNPYVVKM